MPRTVGYTVAYERDGGSVDLCKVIFGGDGTYYVTTPYHPHDRALLAILTVNYAHDDLEIPMSEALDVAVLDDDERRLKLSHHPDGFLQFSGEGVVSGRNADGSPKGLGVRSWPLIKPTLGPSFSVAFSDPFGSGRPSKGGQNTVTLPDLEIEHMSVGQAGLHIVGYYFPARWREFVYRGHDGGWWMCLVHPQAQAAKPLRILLASKESDLPGFIGVEARPHAIEVPNGEAAFFLASSTGHLRRNADGDLIGDQLVCMYPNLDVSNASMPSLNYALADVPYSAPGRPEP